MQRHVLGHAFKLAQEIIPSQDVGRLAFPPPLMIFISVRDSTGNFLRDFMIEGFVLNICVNGDFTLQHVNSTLSGGSFNRTAFEGGLACIS